ncbi:MAG: transglutaminase TgpA family protein [Acidimicrobiia bacterium]
MAPRRSHELAVVALAALSVAAALSLGRVFDAGSFVLPVVGAALLPHALSAVTRRRGWGMPSTVALSVAALAVYVVWAVDPGATWYGVPSGSTLDALGRHLRDGYDELRTAVVPVPVTDGALLLAIAATWVMAQTADVLAFRRDACIAAVAPALALFIWAATLGTSELRVRTTVGFAAAAVVFLLCQHQALLERHRAWFAGRRLGTGTGLLTAGALAGVVAVVGGAVLGPALPGAESDALVDVKGFGQGGEGDGPARSYQTEPPLARIGDNFATSEEREVFTVRSGVAEYWRIAALDTYSSDDGGQWTLTAEGPDEVAEGLAETEQRSDVVLQEFRIGALDGRWMPAAYRAVSVEGGDALVVKASTTLVTGGETVSGLAYTVRSQIPSRSDVPLARRTAPDDAAPPPDLRAYTELPTDFPRDVRERAEEVVANAVNPYERASALEEFFRSPEQGFVYDLEVDLGPTAQNQSAIRDFLSEGRRRGFCVQFAGSYAAMARAVGLPARVAVGYTPGDFDAGTRTYQVTSYDAHAWPEVWLGADAGWVRFEPTPPSTDGRGGSVATEGTAPDDRGETPTSTPTTQAVPPSNAPATAPSGASGDDPTVDVNIDAPGNGGGDGFLVIRPAIVVAAAAIVILAVAGAAAAVVVAKARRRSRRRARPDATDAIAGAWEETLERLREAGVATVPALTPLELADGARLRVPKAAAAPLRSLAETYTAARYGADTPTSTEAARAWAQVGEIDRALADDVSVWVHWRRRLDPAPLRSEF